MEPFERTLSEASAKLASRELSPVALMESLLGRIEKMEPSLKAWVTLDPETALQAARESEEELITRGPRGPLHGMPVGLKDIFYTAGIRTTACSEVYADFVPTYDATCVARLKEAGAIILGKLVTTPYAAGDPSTTVNPWNPAHTPGGSSSGSCVAVASRMCPAALGSQTVGSTLRPAAYNGIVGLKATFGRISLYGIIPLGWSLDHVGMLVRSVEDAALLLQVMAGGDPHDPTSSFEPVPDYLESLKRSQEPPRIGVVGGYFRERATEEIRKHTDEVVRRLAQAGAKVEDVKLPGSFEEIPVAGDVTFQVEAAVTHEAEFKAGPHRYPPRIRVSIEKGMQRPAVEYSRAQQARATFAGEIQETIRGLDVLLTPSTPSQAPRDLSTTGDRAFQGPWTTSGLPTISLPSGLDSLGLPLAIQLVGPRFGEGGLLAAARWCEATLGVNLSPPVG